MRLQSIITCIIILLGGNSFVNFSSKAQGIDFFHGTWQEAKVKAEDEGKPIFVDAYTTWCGPCKRMASQVFVLENVGTYFNAHFINIKIDMESKEGQIFGREYPVSAFPTLMFIQPNGDVISKTVGGRDANGLIVLGESASQAFDGSVKYMKKYEAGDRSYETIYHLIKSLNANGKPTIKIANDYLSSEPNISEQEMSTFLIEALTDADSKIYEMVIRKIRIIEKYVAEKTIKERLIASLQVAARKAADFQYRDILDNAFLQYEEVFSNDAKINKPSIYKEYYRINGNAEMYIETLEQEMKHQSFEDEYKKLTYLTNAIVSFPRVAKLHPFYLRELKVLTQKTDDAFLLGETSKNLRNIGLVAESEEYYQKGLAKAEKNDSKQEYIEKMGK